jgi:hypothetical protein
MFKAAGVGLLSMLLDTTTGPQNIRAATITAGLAGNAAGGIDPTSSSTEFTNFKRTVGVAPADLDTLRPGAIPGHTSSYSQGTLSWGRWSCVSSR